MMSDIKMEETENFVMLNYNYLYELYNNFLTKFKSKGGK